jgi:DNA-binding MarR family transcriptional regulator
MDTTPAPRDPTRDSHWRPLKRLLDAMDADIARLYAERGVEVVRPRFVLPLLRLQHEGPMTIRELAASLEVTHSAASQTVAAMRRAGLITSTPGQDRRSRTIELTDQARELVPLLEAEWRATEQAVVELEEELPYPLTRVVRDIELALARRSFRDRIAARLPDDAAGKGQP